MNDLIPINFDGDRPTVLGRDLHAFLEVGTAYKDWFPRMCEYGFTEGTDFCSFLSESTGGRPAQDHQLTIDMAKEISMLQRNEKGKMARQYFIDLEKKWNSPEAIMARALQMADKKLLQLQGKIEQDKPLVDFAKTCAASQNSVLVRELAKVASKHGLTIGERRLYAKLREWKMIFQHSTEPYQEYVDRGYFEITQSPKENANGVQIYRTTRVTTKGQIYIINRLKREAI